MNANEPIAALLDEVRLLFHQAVRTGEALHSGESITLGMRGVLEFLHLNGPASVPQLARRRLVTRQHVQALVNALLEKKRVALAPNPAHRRSALVTLTPAGRRQIERMRAREARHFAKTDLGVGPQALEQAARTLAQVRRALGGR